MNQTAPPLPPEVGAAMMDLIRLEADRAARDTVKAFIRSLVPTPAAVVLFGDAMRIVARATPRVVTPLSPAMAESSEEDKRIAACYQLRMSCLFVARHAYNFSRFTVRRTGQTPPWLIVREERERAGVMAPLPTDVLGMLSLMAEIGVTMTYQDGHTEEVGLDTLMQSVTNDASPDPFPPDTTLKRVTIIDCDCQACRDRRAKGG